MARRAMLLCLPLLLFAVRGLGAAGPRAADEPRYYVGATWVRSTVLGDFTGDLYLSDGYQLLAVPGVGDGWGFGGVLGFRRRDVGLEVAYERSPHSGLWAGSVLLDSRLEVLTLGLRWYPFGLSVLQPFVLGGCSAVKLTVFDGATDGVTTRDETFWGIGLDLGAGVGVGIGRHVSLAAQAVYRWARYNTVDDFYGGNVTITDGLDGRGFDLAALILISW